MSEVDQLREQLSDTLGSIVRGINQRLPDGWAVGVVIAQKTEPEHAVISVAGFSSYDVCIEVLYDAMHHAMHKKSERTVIEQHGGLGEDGSN